jgi:hypothetical protein
MPFHPAPFQRVAPELDTAAIYLEVTLTGWVGDRVRANEENWLIPAPTTNPGIIEMFAHRLDPAIPGLTDNWWVPWVGEFAGKYLISAVQSLRLRKSIELKQVVIEFVRKLLSTQGEDGSDRSLGMPRAWDLWGQYHVMLGLLRWYEYSGDTNALTGCRRAADLACARYLDRAWAIAKDPTVRPEKPGENCPGEDEKNQAIAHVLALLYERTGESRYLDLVHAIEAEWPKTACYNANNTEAVLCGNFIENALAGQEFYLGTRNRWESLHDVQAIPELYFITGDARYRTAFEQIWRSIRKCDRRVTGGFSSFEEAKGNAYDPRYIETCASVAWMALTIDMLRMTAESTAADELELSLFNTILGAQSPDGRLWTYHTPMGGIPVGDQDHAARLGYRLPAYYDLSWQARDRYCQLSCCAANGPRGLGCLSEWAVMLARDGGIVINYYGPLTLTLTVARDMFPFVPAHPFRIMLSMETAYPLDGVVRIKVKPYGSAFFPIRLRIPEWSRKTSVLLNGVLQAFTVAGSYCELKRTWRQDDVITLTLDMSIHTVAGKGPASGLSAAYRGPLLLAYDTRFNSSDPLSPPAPLLSAVPRIVSNERGVALFATFPSAAGDINLCDFASAGQSDAGALVGPPDSAGTWQLLRCDPSSDPPLAAKTLIAEKIRLLSDGTIEGSTHPNETRWSYRGNALIFFDANFVPTTCFTVRTRQHGKEVLSGMLGSSVRHVLAQVDFEIVGKTWQLWRKDLTGTTTILKPLIRLLPGGEFDQTTHPNESRWAIEHDILVFYAADGTPSTRFTSLRMQNGRVERSGTFLLDPSITHYLSEVDLDLISLIWRFKRKGEAELIADKVRLLPNKKLDGYTHFNETSWNYDGAPDRIMFVAKNGLVSTHFRTMRAAGGVMTFEGSFEFDSSITHILEEQCPGWSIHRNYIVWLPTLHVSFPPALPFATKAKMRAG